jgi:hypothetical protein
VFCVQAQSVDVVKDQMDKLKLKVAVTKRMTQVMLSMMKSCSAGHRRWLTSQYIQDEHGVCSVLKLRSSRVVLVVY